jgi:hypothetical protein
MKRALVFIAFVICLLMLVGGCNVHTQQTMCYDMSMAQYNEIKRRRGAENAGIMQCTTTHPDYTYHNQAMERIDGVWWYAPNYPVTVILSRRPQKGCKPIKRLK